MQINKIRFPGARIYKTIIAITIALCLSKYLLQTSGFYMTVAVLLSMKVTSEKSKIYGKDRILGTIMGGFLGYVALAITNFFHIHEESMLMLVFILVCIFLFLWISKIIDFGETEAAMGCVVFLSITLVRFNDPIISHVIWRVFETSIGVIIAIVINTINTKKIANKIRSIKINS